MAGQEHLAGLYFGLNLYFGLKMTRAIEQA